VLQIIHVNLDEVCILMHY